MPVWFQEGVAQFYAYANPTNSFWKGTRLDELTKLMKHAPWLELDRLEHVIRNKDTSPGTIYLAYLESEALVLYLAQERGDSWIPSLITHIKEGSSFTAAFQQVVGLNTSQMLDQLHHSIE